MFSSLESWGKKSINDLPYISIPAGQLPKIREKIETEQNISEKCKTPPQKLHVRYKNAKRKLVIASQMSKESQNLVKRTAVNRDLALVTPPRKKASSKNNISKSWTLYLVKLHVYNSNVKKLI